jgi:hypothetical protein
MSQVRPTITFTGIKQLDDKLQRIEKRDGRRIARKAMRRGLSVLQKALKVAAPVGPKKPTRRGRPLRKAIGQRFGKSRTNDAILSVVGVNVKLRKDQQAPHGAAATLRTSRGPGNAFVETTVRGNLGAAMNVIESTVAEEINALR